jgi:hypothetical protein
MPVTCSARQGSYVPPAAVLRTFTGIGRGGGPGHRPFFGRLLITDEPVPGDFISASVISCTPRLRAKTPTGERTS